jgi:putative ABC transport system permease protein
MLMLRAMLRRGQVEREMEAELAQHLDAEIQELIARGMPPDQARRQAAATMGRLEDIREECRDSRGTAGWEQFTKDTAFGVRLLAKNRTFTLIALATMALGIGSTTAVFSLIDGVLLRPLPFPEQDRLFYAVDVGMRGPFDKLRGNSRTADYAAYWDVRSFSTKGRDFPERLKGSEVSANFFSVLGAKPLLGETLTEGDDRPGRPKRIILSHDFWTEHYQARPEIVGQQLTLDETPYQIIGVMPADFRYPSMAEAKFWIPIRIDPRDIGEYWGMGGLMSIARLRPGVPMEAAQSELDAWIPRIRSMFPWRMPDAWGRGARLTGLRDHLVAGARLRSLVLLSVVALVLLIAVVNVANLMIGQTAARQRELALRASLGATPRRLARQLLTEALVLAVAGGLLGTLFAFGQLSLLKHLLPADTPRLGDVSIDRRVLAFTAAISLGSGLFFGLLPAWRMRTLQSLTALEGGHSTGAPSTRRTDAALVVTEAAFSTILVVGAGLLLHTFWTLLHVDPGFQVESVVTAELSPNREMADSARKIAALYDQARTKLASYPGVTHVAGMNVLPLTPRASAFAAAIEDHPRPPQEPQFVLWNISVTPEHLETLHIPLLSGRGFTAADRLGAPLVVLVSRSTARRFWPDRDPVGRRLRPVFDKEWRTIVGVVEDVKNYSITGPPEWANGEVYVPLAQPVDQPHSISLAVRVAGDPTPFEKQLPLLIHDVCSNCAVSRIARMETVVANALQAPRSTAWLVGGFAMLALVLACAGIYGVVSHRILRRTREFGVRLALGASRAHIVWQVMGPSLRYTLIGTFLGLAASWALTRWIRTLLYGVAAHDAVSFSLAPVVLLAAALLACLLPACRAVRIDPAASLRAE